LSAVLIPVIFIASGMPGHQIFIGSTVALLCLWGLFKHRWFLETTKKGKRLIARFGDRKAAWILNGLFVMGIVFGILLAIDVIHPIRW